MKVGRIAVLMVHIAAVGALAANLAGCPLLFPTTVSVPSLAGMAQTAAETAIAARITFWDGVMDAMLNTGAGCAKKSDATRPSKRA